MCETKLSLCYNLIAEPSKLIRVSLLSNSTMLQSYGPDGPAVAEKGSYRQLLFHTSCITQPSLISIVQISISPNFRDTVITSSPSEVQHDHHEYRRTFSRILAAVHVGGLLQHISALLQAHALRLFPVHGLRAQP